MADPQNVLALDDLRIITGYDIKPAISTKDDIVAAIEEYYKVAEQRDEDDASSAPRTSADEELDAAHRGRVARRPPSSS